MQIQSLNCLLRGSASHFNESYMCEQLEAGIDKELCILGHEAKVHDTESIRDFLGIYKLCDAKRKITQKAVQFEDTMHNNKKTYNKKENHPNSFHPYERSTNSTSSTKCNYLPKLTDEEKDIIRKCSGCFKCRKLYVQPGHAAQT